MVCKISRNKPFLTRFCLEKVLFQKMKSVIGLYNKVKVDGSLLSTCFLETKHEAKSAIGLCTILLLFHVKIVRCQRAWTCRKSVIGQCTILLICVMSVSIYCTYIVWFAKSVTITKALTLIKETGLFATNEWSSASIVGILGKSMECWHFYSTFPSSSKGFQCDSCYV